MTESDAGMSDHVADSSPSGPPQIDQPHPRQLLEQAVECLIAFFDLLDPDPDLEPNGDAEEEPDGEPSLGSLDAQPQTRWADGLTPGHEVDCELDKADDEPSLGSTGCLGNDNQEQSWGACSGTTDDRERTGYACETEDEEPALGWGADIGQTSLQQGYAVLPAVLGGSERYAASVLSLLASTQFTKFGSSREVSVSLKPYRRFPPRWEKRTRASSG
jgi:hypothetical protein